MTDPHDQSKGKGSAPQAAPADDTELTEAELRAVAGAGVRYNLAVAQKPTFSRQHYTLKPDD
ncbi:MAG: hypothetical protein H6983_06835 [Ectothiorhodospiraceae bacterium]|nr:hypothetical protein [Chromatiales bacterium]MCP5153862.1 hypothetical protein [Ectothiorhodospiraceae bacterium]